LEDFPVKSTSLFLSFTLLAAPLALAAQTTTIPYGQSAQVSRPGNTPSLSSSIKPKSKTTPRIKPLSRVAFGGGISAMGVNMQVATNLNRHFNLRGVGNYFNYTASNISTNGFNVDAKLNMATAGASLDFYPFATHGFRLSPGGLFYNQNRATANAPLSGGGSFTFNNQTYYSAYANPATGATPVNFNGSLGLNANKQAFTLTTGWGNMIPRKGGHWSFPFEAGVAFVGKPAIAVNLSGWACSTQPTLADPADPLTCADLAGTSSLAQSVQGNKNQQVYKWKNDLDPLKTYPIFSFGVAYDFPIR
jgi:hypothetical protein